MVVCLCACHWEPPLPPPRRYIGYTWGMVGDWLINLALYGRGFERFRQVAKLLLCDVIGYLGIFGSNIVVTKTGTKTKHVVLTFDEEMASKHLNEFGKCRISS